MQPPGASSQPRALGKRKAPLMGNATPLGLVERGEARKNPKASPRDQISFTDRFFLDVVVGLQQAGDATTTPGFFKRLSKTLQKEAAINNADDNVQKHRAPAELTKCSILEARLRYKRLEKSGLLTPSASAHRAQAGQQNSAAQGASSAQSFQSNSTVSRHSTGSRRDNGGQGSGRLDVPTSTNANKRKWDGGHDTGSGGGQSRGARMMRVGNRSTDSAQSSEATGRSGDAQGSASALRNVSGGATMLTSPGSTPSNTSGTTTATLLGSPSEGFSPRYRSQSLRALPAPSILQPESAGTALVVAPSSLSRRVGQVAHQRRNPPATIFRPQHPMFSHFKACQNVLRKRLSLLHVPDTKQLVGIEKQRSDVQRILERTMRAAENNSVLILGARGRGKSVLLNHVLKSIKKKFVETPRQRSKRSSASSARSDRIPVSTLASPPMLSQRGDAQRGQRQDARRPLMLSSPRVSSSRSSSSESERLALGSGRASRGLSLSRNRRAKRSTVARPRVLVLGSAAKSGYEWAKLLKKINGTLETSNGSAVTHVVLEDNSIERSLELLEILAKPSVQWRSGSASSSSSRSSRSTAAHIVSIDWVFAGIEAGYAVEETDYVPEDPRFERTYGISMEEALSRRKSGSALLQHCTVYITAGVTPGRSALRKCITNAGGKVLNSLPKQRNFGGALGGFGLGSGQSGGSQSGNAYGFLPMSTSIAGQSADLMSPLSPAFVPRTSGARRLLVIGTREDLSEENGAPSDDRSGGVRIVDQLRTLGVEKVYNVNVLLDGILHHRLSLAENVLLSLTGETEEYAAVPSPASGESPRQAGADSGAEADDDDGLSKYEKDRLERIRDNQAFMESIGLTSVRRDIADAMGGKLGVEARGDEAKGDEAKGDEAKEDEAKGDELDDASALPPPPERHVGNLSSTAPFVVIRLNGLVHSDEKTALREIGRQLYLEYESYKISSRSLSFGHHVQLLLDVLREAKGVSVPIVFVLDEFQGFTMRPKQTLLYHLLDILQSGETQMAVVGLTEKLDVVESLEKRIKSRFSHRQIYVPPISLEQTVLVLKQTLELEASACPDTSASFVSKWNSQVQALAKSRDFRGCIERYHSIGHPTRWFLRLASVALSFLNFASSERASYAAPFLKLDHFKLALKKLVVDRRDLGFKTLTTVETMLLLSIGHLEKCNSVPYNFEMCYDEYTKLLRLEDEGGSVGISTYKFSKPIMFKAFEHLLAIGLCKSVGVGSTGVFHGVLASNSSSARQYDLRYQGVRLLFGMQHLKELFRGRREDLPTLVKTWTQKWI